MMAASSDSSTQMIKYASALAGVGAAAALVYYLLQEDAGEQKDDSAAKVLNILQQIQVSQNKMKEVMKDLTKQLLEKDMSFPETYELVKSTQPADPLEAHGISMQQFDALLDETQNDPRVRERISTIMSNPQDPSPETNRVPPGMTVSKLVEVHGFMLDELQTIVRDFHKMPNKKNFDIKTVTIAAQAIVGARMQRKYKLSTDDVEAAVLQMHHQLSTDQEFARINIEMQQTMSKLVQS